MFPRLLSLLLPTLLAIPALAGDLLPAVLDGSLWQKDKQALAASIASARYMPVDANTLRFPRQNSIHLATLEHGDVLVSFDEESSNIRLLQASIYNKGDDGPMDKKEFGALLEETICKLDSLTGTKGRPHKVLARDAGIRVNARLWQTEHGALLLEAASSGKSKNFVTEFIRLTLGPNTAALERGGAHDAARRSSLRNKVKTEENGDVWIEGIPMVDQGQKGYCVPATVARVFSHYGMDGVDQHALAALCKSSGSRGTTMNEMEDALKDIGHKFHMSIAELDKGGFSAFISDYNAAAKKLKKPRFNLSPLGMSQPDTEVMLAARAAKPAQLRKWMKPVKKSIDAGLPVLWSVLLAFPEPGLPQTGGGHMRLIIGYNEEAGTIIYSDSWGAFHARKEMPLTHAAAMTIYRYVLRPTR